MDDAEKTGQMAADLGLRLDEPRVAIQGRSLDYQLGKYTRYLETIRAYSGAFNKLAKRCAMWAQRAIEKGNRTAKREWG